ncbi:MAG: porin family protein [Flavobacteriaceae bacterium]|nr:PorT family protein [Flavobacteriaceae bacterium]
MYKIISCIFLLVGTLGSAQNDSIVDQKYLEDQIYVGFSYIILNKPSEGVKQKGFSNNLSLGFIKDMPLNERGNLAFGVGLGYGRNTYFQNIKIEKVDGNTQFSLLGGDVSYRSNKFSTHMIEAPLELRWRSSTIDKYKFWRIYGGAKFSYAFATNAKLKDDSGKLKTKGIDEINNFQYGLTFSVGYGTWNFNFYYGLSDVFDKAYLEDTTPLNTKDFRVGLIFYIL